MTNNLTYYMFLGELINPGDDHKEIIFYLQQRNNLPKHIESRITYRMSLKQ